MCWHNRRLRLVLHLTVSVAGCLGYDVLAAEFDNLDEISEFQLLVV